MCVVRRVKVHNLKSIINVTQILNRCGKDMAQKYNLHHWNNSLFKTFVIVIICLIKNAVYVVEDGKRIVATFQIRTEKNFMFFEKLAVDPNLSGRGYGKYCMGFIEDMARENDCKKVRMDVYDRSQHAIDFYLHMGYYKVETTKTIRYTNLIMEKEM